MEGRDAYRSELLEEITHEFDHTDALEREVEQLRRQVTELRDGVCSKQHGAERTFTVTELPCPECGHYQVFGFNYTDSLDTAMHTYYMCRYWKSKAEGADSYTSGKCGWSDWSVPGWDQR